MPTSSQSKILSVVDYQLLQQQQATEQNAGTSQVVPTVDVQRRPSRDVPQTRTSRKNEDINRSPSPRNLSARLRSSSRTGAEGGTSSRSAPRTDYLQVPPIINLNTMAPEESRSTPYSRNALHSNSQLETAYQSRQMSTGGHYNSSSSDAEDGNDEDAGQQQSGLLSENARRLLVLGTIRPSKSFYRGLPAADVEHLMEYFRRMRNTNRKLTSEEINEELQTKYTEYQPKMFFDSAVVTKSQIRTVEKLVEPYADQIRADRAELVKLDNPTRFVIKPINQETPLTTIPREYNDCVLTLVSRTDPVYKSDLITELVRQKLSEDVKANSLDISYFPGGVNYDVPRDEIEENGLMKLETYQKLKKRLNSRKVWYFNGPPDKKPNALLAILPSDISITIDHQRLLDCLYDRLKTLSPDTEPSAVKQRILSLEYLPLSCILNSPETADQFIIDCDCAQTKKQLMDKPLKFSQNKQSIVIELHSYDEDMHREYEKSVKAEKYRELIKNHDESTKRTSATK